MSKILPASCVASLVTVGGKPIQALILSQGIKSSNGLALLEESEASYVTSNASDIHDLIVSLVAIIEKISLIATGLDANTVVTGTQAANITALGVLKTTLNATKDNLK